MKESLVCSSCNKTWKREKVRGRKPILCPNCIPQQITEPRKATPVKKTNSIKTKQETDKQSIAKSTVSLSKVFNAIYPKNKDSQTLSESTKDGSVWRCPSCGHIITLFVSVSDIPTHRCTPDTVTVKLCERIK